MTNVKPIISRIGGKYFNKKKILKAFPPIDDYNTFVDVFLGGGNILLNAPRVEHMIGTDTDELIVKLFNAVKRVDPDFVYDYNFKKSRKRFDILKNYKPETDEEYLYKVLYLSKYSYLGKRESYVSSGDKPSINIDNLHEIIKIVKERLKGVKIEKSSFENTIDKYDSDNTFFYLDPPYYETYTGAYQTGDINHEELRDILKDVKGKWLLTYNDHPYIRKLYKGFKIRKYSAQQIGEKGGRGSRKLFELLISNY